MSYILSSLTFLSVHSEGKKVASENTVLSVGPMQLLKEMSNFNDILYERYATVSHLNLVFLISYSQ
jgi:hypothetical protein